MKKKYRQHGRKGKTYFYKTNIFYELPETTVILTMPKDFYLKAQMPENRKPNINMMQQAELSAKKMRQVPLPIPMTRMAIF